MILSWLAKQLLDRVTARLRAGDIRLGLALYANDVRMTFPGDNSWSGVYRGKKELKAWLERFARVGIQIYPDEVIAVGPPWNTRACIRGHDYVKSPEGETVYANRYVIWVKLKWGRIKEEETYEDTQKPKALDAWLEQHQPHLALAS
jgi:ketosteroid isomerase-like protein